MEPDAPYPGMPHWVKMGILVALVTAGLLVLAMLLLGGEHGPGRHFAP